MVYSVLYNLMVMERDSVYVSSGILENETIGNKLAYQWVEERLKLLKQDFKLGRFKADPRNFVLIKTDERECVQLFLGQEELGEEAIGFVAGFVNRKLKMLSVFADLEDRIVWVRREGYREQSNQVMKD